MAVRSNGKEAFAAPTAAARRRPRRAPTQERIMVFLHDYKADPANDGNSPTYAEIAAALRLSQTTVYNAVQRLVSKGRLRLTKNRRIMLPGGAYHPPDE